MQDNRFSITNTTKDTLPRVPFAKIKDKALGKNYCLSIVFIGKNRSKTLNKNYRGKDKPTNILSFPLDKKSGEIFITMDVAKKQAKSFGRKIDNFVAFLFIHGLVHLKGHAHGSRMERMEEQLRKQLKV